jgi:hypothetical protein
MMAGVCVLVAGCIAAITAVEVWKIKKRGRSLAMTAAPILEIFTLWFLVGSAGTIGGYEFWTAISILMLGVITVVYLRLPSFVRGLNRKPWPREIPKFTSCIQETARVHSQLPACSEAAGEKSSSGQERSRQFSLGASNLRQPPGKPCRG